MLIKVRFLSPPYSNYPWGTCLTIVVTEGRCARCAALQVLGLEAGATDGEIKAAYRMLVKVWHPDRFEGDRNLKASAEEKLKSINTAFRFLALPSSKKARPTQPKTAASPAQTQEPNQRRETGSKQAAPAGEATKATQPKSDANGEAPKRPPNAAPPSPPAQPAPAPARPNSSSSPVLRTFLRWATFTCAIGFGRYLLQMVESKPSGDTVATKTYDNERAKALGGLDVPIQKQSYEITRGLQSSNQRKAAIDSPHGNQKIRRTTPQKEKETRPQPIVTSSSLTNLPYITIGSSKDHVLAIQGTPTAFSQNLFEYGASAIYFRDGKVVNWKNWPALNPLRVKLPPNVSADRNLDYFTVGSTKDEVLAVQGTPTAFSQDEFEYGASQVYFKNGEVVSWKNWPELNPLRAKLHCKHQSPLCQDE
ncbi:MAG: J domain-containing protein [Acidobacteriaceae bacterium]